MKLQCEKNLLLQVAQKAGRYCSSKEGEQLFISEDFLPFNCITFSTNYSSITGVLPKGLENAISAKELARTIGAKDLRGLRTRITLERIRGAPILSMPGGGYFLTDDGEKSIREAEILRRMMDSRTLTTAKATEAERGIIRGQCGQT